MSWSLILAACVLCRLGSPAKVAKLFGAGDTALKRSGAAFASTDPWMRAFTQGAEIARRSMGDDAFFATYKEGSTLSLQEAVEIALEHVRQLTE